MLNPPRARRGCSPLVRGRHPAGIAAAGAGLAAAALGSAVVVTARRAAAMAVAGERRRLARELHDTIAPQLYGIGLGARVARALLRDNPAQADRELEQIGHSAATGLAETRRLMFQMRPEALAGDGLANALSRLLDTLHDLHGVATCVDVEPRPGTDPEVLHGVYRIAQEAVRNAARHASARRVTVRLSTQDSVLLLEVEDDGTGFDPKRESAGRLGLGSMRERAEDLGGRLDILSSPGRGTLIRARLPSRS
jgi:signal transduction histidine kinase